MLPITMAAFLSALPAFDSPRAIAESVGATGNGTPEGLSASDWSSIRAAFDDKRHEVVSDEVGFRASNPDQQWQLHFDGAGFDATPNAGGWSWGLQLISYGRTGSVRFVSRPSCSEAIGGRINYIWDRSLTEWFINDHRGVEHGFTVLDRPTVSPPTTQVSPLQFTLSVRGNLFLQVSSNGCNVTFTDKDGASIVSYSGLSVFDADGAAVPAWFEVAPEGLLVNVDDDNARYPLTIDPIAQQAYLKASNTDAGDEFGLRVAVSGDTVVVAARSEDSDATGINGDEFNNNLTNSGAVYVFVRDGASWSQQAYLKASNPGPNDYFGWSLAIDGDTVVVGALGEDSNAAGVDGDPSDNTAEDAGAAYVFVRNGTTWAQQAYLKASNPETNDNFGQSVAVSGDTVVVSAIAEESSATGVDGDQIDNSAINSGAAYVFVRTGTTWTQQAYLKASNTEAFDFFGRSVAVSGDTIVVGAHLEDSNATGVNGIQLDNNAGASGAAYVFVRNGSSWAQEAYLKASNTDATDQFGNSVAVSGDTIVVGASHEDSNSTGVDGNELNNAAEDSGAAYVFVRSGNSWSQQAYLKASNSDPGDSFGYSLAASGETIVAGALDEDSSASGMDGTQSDNTAADSGAAYVFVRSGTSWNQQAYLKASNSDPGDWFGFSVATSGNSVVVGAQREDSNATGVDGDSADDSADSSGAAYIYCGFGPDSDGDGVLFATDNCPFIANPGQEDEDNDGAGDACDLCPGFDDHSDSDSDGIPDGCDPCPSVATMLGDVNGDQAIDSNDIAGFATVLLNPGTATAAELCAADTNGDLFANGLDVLPFVDLLMNQ